MVATWSDSDVSNDNSYDDEIANLCLMEIDDSKITSTSCDSNSYTFHELQDAFEELAIDFESMNMKYKKMIAKLNIENELLFKAKNDLKKNIDCMKIEIDELTKKNTNLQNSFTKFYMGQQKLNRNSHEASSTCTYCHRLGHSRQFFPLKVITFRGKLVKSVWIPKGISTSLNEDAKKKWIPKGTKIVSTNTQGPKKIWVPKIGRAHV